MNVAVHTQAAPLSPEQELASFRLADEALVIELVAAEPDLVSPVAIAWDADGRLFAAEMNDYPTGPAGGRIRMLEDRDGDGRYETSTVFADHLAFPNGVLPWRGGLLVTAAPDILYLKDTDGDGRADERRVILTGFAEGNQQLRVNGLLWGLDGWVYGANGRSDGEMRRPDGNVKVSLRGHDFRFRPETGECEAVAGRSQFGLARDDWGNRFLSWNTIPVRHEVIPERYLTRHPRLSVTTAVRDLLPAGDTGEVFPISLAPQTFNQESTSHFNALAGLTIYRGDALPAAYRGNAFVGETLRNLVHRRTLEADGPSFLARRAEQGREFLASTDPWFHPVNFATGPDGALYVVDFYRAWVEHPGFVPEKQRGSVDWRTGANHGRLWRVRPRTGWSGSRRPQLAKAGPQELVQHLEHTNGWWRDTAQRLLLEAPERGLVVALNGIASRSPRAESRVQALETLHCLRGLDDSLLSTALTDRHPRVRETAARLAEGRSTLESRLPALTRDADARTRLQAVLSLGRADDLYRVDALKALANKPAVDPITFQAIRCSAWPQPWPVLERSWLARDVNAARLEFVRAMASDVAAAAHAAGRERLLALLASAGGRSAPDYKLALLAGYARGLETEDQRREFQAWLTAAENVRTVDALIVAAGHAAVELESLVLRDLACSVLASIPTTNATARLLGLLLPTQTDGMRSAAANAIAATGDAKLLEQVFARWDQYSIKTRRRLIAGATSSAKGAAVVVKALHDGRVVPAELDAAARQSLLQNATDKKQAQQLLGTSSTERTTVLENYRPALQLTGEARRGAVSFARLCLQCHAVPGRGTRLGPDLSGLSSRSAESLLTDILDPSRQVTPDYVSYSVTTSTGEAVTGLLVSETTAGLTLRRANAPDERLERSQVREVRASGKSLMPDGLEAGLSVQDMADLLAFLRQPDPALLPAE